MMHMTFYWGRKVTLLFDSWKTDSWLSYGLTLLACLIFSIFYQYMEERRLRFKLLSANSSSAAAKAYHPIIQNPDPTTTPLLFSTPSVGSRWNPSRFAAAILFGINAAIGYMLMLAVMSFNGGVFVAVICGLAIGYLLFRGGEEEVVMVDNPCACA